MFQDVSDNKSGDDADLCDEGGQPLTGDDADLCDERGKLLTGDDADLCDERGKLLTGDHPIPSWFVTGEVQGSINADVCSRCKWWQVRGNSRM